MGATEPQLADPLPNILREWAEWWMRQESLGYPESTTLWLMQLGSGRQEFKSSIPTGVSMLEVRGALRRIVRAMDRLRADPDEEVWLPTLLVQCWYTSGPEAVRDVTGKSRASLYQMLKIGETLIRHEMKLK